MSVYNVIKERGENDENEELQLIGDCCIETTSILK
jgi:hypothetical protein